MVMLTVNERTPSPVYCKTYHVKRNLRQNIESVTKNSDSLFGLELNYLSWIEFNMVMSTVSMKRFGVDCDFYSVCCRHWHMEVDH